MPHSHRPTISLRTSGLRRPDRAARRPAPRHPHIPRLEALEDRTLLSFSLASGVPYPAGSGPNSVAVGDFNADGRPDLAVVNENSGSVSVLLGNGDGTFRGQQTFGAGSLPCFVAVGDFNADGKPDLAVANFLGSNVSVLLGNGDGTFRGQQTFGVGNRPLSVAVGDFNRDGKPDLAVANSSDATVSVLPGNGDGTFQGQQTFGAGSGPYTPFSVAVGDFNADGKPDLATANYLSNNVSVLLGNGDGTFQGQQTFAVGAGPYSVAVGDFNADGKPDLAVANYSSNYVSVLLGNGDGAFQGQRTFATSGGTHNSLAVGDFDGDGKLDLAIDNSGSNTVDVLLGDGDGTFQGYQSFVTGQVPESVAVGDFNRDGAPDVATANYSSNDASVLLNRAPKVTVVDAGGTYNGSAFPATASNVGLDGVTPVSGSYTFTYTNTADNSTSSGAPVNAGTYTVVAHFTSSDPNYRDTVGGPTRFTIAPVLLSGSITAANKVYDGTTAATITSRTLTGVLASDEGNVSYVGGTATFADPDVGTGKTVTARGLSLSGPAAGNYSVNSTATTTVDITPPPDMKPTASISGPTASVTGQSLTFTISATDPVPSLDAAGFAYTVHWGDGSQDTTVPASAGNGSGVAVSHAFAAGPYTVQVTATDQDHNSGTASLGVTASSADTATALSTSAASPTWGQEVTFTATVTAVAPGGGAPTGTVTFYDGSTTLGSAKLQVVNGVDQAVFPTTALTVGGHTITASYATDGDYNGSNSDAVSVNVSKVTPTVTWDNPADITYGTALGSAQLDATANVSGAFAYTPGAGTVLHAGAGQALSVVFTPGDTAHYASATQSVVINVTPAVLSVTADDKSKVYGEAVPSLTASYTGFVNGDTVAVLGGNPALTTTAARDSAPDAYPITVGVGSLAAADYSFQFVNGTLTVNKAATGTALAVSALTPLAGLDPVTLTASVTITAPGGGALTGSVVFVDTTTGQGLGSAPVVNGVATLPAGPFTAGAHSITATYGGDANFLGSLGTASLTALAPASLSGTVFADFNDDGQVDFGEEGIGGVSVTLTGADDLGHAVSLSQATDGDGAYVFLNLRPSSYYLTKTTQPSGYTPGIDSVGSAGGSLSGTDQFFVQLAQGINGLNYNYGERPAAGGPVQPGQTAGIGFWNNKNGQALILALNGGGGSTQLGDWLAATFAHLYGASSANDLAGKNNASVAALFQQDFLQKGQKLDAQVLATALSVYATNATLDSTQVAVAYGFTVQGDGLGTATANVGGNGAAFAVADNSTMTVMDLLLAADAQAVSGVLYGGNAALRNKANSVFSAVNQAGSVS